MRMGIECHPDRRRARSAAGARPEPTALYAEEAIVTQSLAEVAFREHRLRSRSASSPSIRVRAYPLMTRLHARWLAPSREHATSWQGWAVLGVCAVALLYALVVRPLGSLMLIGGILALGWLYDRPRGPRLVLERPSRPNEDFGSFVRAFEHSGSDPIDPWAVRVVWESVHPLTALRGPAIPLRPTDRFALDLGVDPDEVEELIPGLVERCGRTVGNWSANPYYAGLSTVGALVHFISAQPFDEQRRRIAAR
jgi:hypothetical protein